MGYKYCEKKIIKITRRKNPYCSIKSIIGKRDCGKSEKSILEPSRGGMGTRLNTAKAKLIITMEEVMK